MLDLVFYTDYSPLLTRISNSAFIVYCFYDKFKDENNEVKFTYFELTEHLSITPPTLVKAHLALQKLKMIEPSGEGKYLLLPLTKLTDELKQQIIEEFEIEMPPNNSIFMIKYSEEKWPEEFQQLLSKKRLKAAQKELGDLFTRASSLCEYFNLDIKMFKAVYRRKKFKKEFDRLVLEIKNDALTIKEKERKKKSFCDDARLLTNYLYDKLAEREARPVGNWWFKNCNMANSMLDENFTLDEAKKVIDWAFEDSWWKSKLTNVRILETVRTQYKLSQSKKKIDSQKITRRTPIPEQAKEALKEIPIKIPINVYEDAYFLKQNVLNGEKKAELVKAVEILERFNVIPSGNVNISF